MEEENNDAFKDLFSGMFGINSSRTAPVLVVKKMLEKDENFIKTIFSSGSAETIEERKRNLKQLSSLLIYLEKENLISFSKLLSSFTSFSKENENSETSVYILEHKINVQNPFPGTDKHSVVNADIIGIEYDKQANTDSYPYSMWFYIIPSNLEKYAEIENNCIIVVSVKMEILPDDYIKQIYQELLKLLKK